MRSKNFEIDKKVFYLIQEKLSKNKDKFSDEEIRSFIKDELTKEKILIKEKVELAKIIFMRLRNPLSVLDIFLNDDAVNEIMVIGCENIFIEKNGKVIKSEYYFLDEDELLRIVRKIASFVNREITELNPILDARLSDGSRVNVLYKNLSIRGTTLTIRKFGKTLVSVDDLISFKTINSEMSKFLKDIVRAKYNIFICGGTSSGKTTFLNVLSNFIPKNERIITIEDSLELKINNIENLVSLEVRKNIDKEKEINIRDLIKTSLRMRPDRIIVGEVRGEEVIDMIQAMNTGHDGSLSTGHANSAKASLFRLEAMFLEGANYPIKSIRSQILEAIDIIVHLAKVNENERKIIEISEVVKTLKDGEIVLRPIYQLSNNKFVRVNHDILNCDKLNRYYLNNNSNEVKA